MVAHNVGFDKHFVTNHPAGYPLLENTWVDSLDLARIALPRLKSHRLIDLVHAFDAPVSTHRADDDVAPPVWCTAYCLLLWLACPPIASRLHRDDGPAFRMVHRLRFPANREQNTRLERKQTPERSVRPSGAAVLGERDAPSTDHRAADAVRAQRRRRAGRPAAVSIARGNRAGLHPEGVLGRIYPDYEPREEQRQMAAAIREAFETSDNLVVEAGTGVGKSMAYLVPAALSRAQRYGRRHRHQDEFPARPAWSIRSCPPLPQLST